MRRDADRRRRRPARDHPAPAAPLEDFPVDRVSIPKEVRRRGRLGEGLDELPRGPASGGMIRGVEMDEFAPVMPPATKTNSRRKVRVGTPKKSIATSSRASAVRKRATWATAEATAGACPWRWSARRPRDRAGEFRLAAAAAPGRMVPSHPVDHVANLGVELRSADPTPRGLPSPVELEGLTVPGKDGRGLHDDETGPPARPDLREPDPDSMKRQAIP